MDSAIQHRIIEEAVGRYELSITKRPRPMIRPARLITISRQVAAGGRQIAERICERLGCLVWGREILDVLASQSGGHYHARMFKLLDESTQGAIDEIVSEFFGKIGRHTYLYLLPRAILTVAQGDAVILGRGAHLVLPQAYHVRITAPLEYRLEAVMRYDQLSLKEAESKIRVTDRQREKFLKDFAATIHARHFRNGYDLILNTERIPVQDAAALILHGFELFEKTSREHLRAAG